MSIKKERVGYSFTNNQGCHGVVIDYKSATQVFVRFDNTPEVVIISTTWDRVLKGQTPNPYYPTTCGVGYLGQGDHKRTINRTATPAYRYWCDMLRRCYDPKFHKREPSYADCMVCDEWHNYQNFAKWFEENYYEIDSDSLDLDKDLLVANNKLYSPKTCWFIPTGINRGFRNNTNRKAICVLDTGEYVVTPAKQSPRFTVLDEAKVFYTNWLIDRHIEKLEFYKDELPTEIYQKLYNVLKNYIPTISIFTR